jgi:hypothetical protein
MRETARHRLSELENELKPMTSVAIKVTERKPPGRVTLPQDEEILIVNEGAEMSPRRRSAPVRAGGMTVAESPPPRMLTVAEVATYLSVSDDTVLKQFGSLPGVIDIGTSGGMHLRQKRVLRIPQRTLERYIADRQVKARR